MSEKIQPVPKEATWTSEINWAKEIYDPKNGDYLSDQVGVTRIMIGNQSYSVESVNREAGVFVRNFDDNDNSTWIFVGHLTRQRMLQIVPRDDSPFNLEDPARINEAAKLAMNLSETYIAWRAAQKIKQEVDSFLNTLQATIPQSDIDTQQAIAVLEGKLKGYIETDYPQKFLDFADQMDRIGVNEILNGEWSKSDVVGNWTPDWIRKHFGENESSVA